MNVALRQKPFKRKPSPIAAQATGSAETFVRYVATKAAGLLGQDEGKFASIKWPADRRLHGVIRASAEPPTDLSNTPALAVMGTDFVESLQPISAAARLFRASRLMLNFDRLGAITVPDLFGIDEGPPAWVESGQPAPVGELTSSATILQPFKLSFIVTVTREMILGIAYGTVKSNLDSARYKLNCATLSQATAIAVGHGIFTPDDLKGR